MSIRCLLLLMTVLLLSYTDRADYPQGYFGFPVRGQVRLSGTFGELRPHHFHAGLDIKGSVGQPLYAAADGYVSKVVVSAGGYGQVVYIQHPNGFTTVYAHLHRFAPAVAAYVRAQQNKKKSFAISLEPQPGQFPVQRGEAIGKMGVTGRSFGPHLHFEIQDTRTGQPINPLLFGLRVADRRPPRLQRLRVYGVDGRGNTQAISTHALRKTGNGYRLVGGDTLRLGQSHIGLAIATDDQLDQAPNRNGVYELQLWAGDSLRFHTQMQTFHPSQSRYLNAHLDYTEWYRTGDYYHRCHRLPGNELDGLYPRDQGILNLRRGQVVPVKLVVRDWAGNASTVAFWVRSTGQKTMSRQTYQYFLPQEESSFLQRPGLQVRFPEGTFYQDTYFDFEEIKDYSDGRYAPAYHLHSADWPVHRAFELVIKPNRPIADSLWEKAYVAYCGSTGRSVNMGGTWQEGWLYTRTTKLGEYTIQLDTMPPDIKPVQFQRDMRRQRFFAFQVSDNLATSGQAEGLRYEGRIDGQWVLFELDAKTGRLSHQLPSDFPKGEHRLQVELVDAVGNVAIWNGVFMR